MIHLNKSKVLVIGSTDRLRRRVASLLGELPGVFTSQRAGCAEIELYLAEHRIDAVLLEAAGGFLEDMERIHQTKPAMPIVAYDDDPGYAATRSALLNGAVDVLRIRSATAPAIEPVLRRALDPISHTFADGLRHREQSIRAISRRGENFSQRLVSGDPPQFYMNGNRATLLRANVLCTGSGLLWRQDAAWAWIQEFGVTNTFLFPSSGSELHLGAIVEQDYINAQRPAEPVLPPAGRVELRVRGDVLQFGLPELIRAAPSGPSRRIGVLSGRMPDAFRFGPPREYATPPPTAIRGILHRHCRARR